MRKTRFALAVLTVVALAVAGLRHINLPPLLLRCNNRASFWKERFAWQLRCVTLSGGFARWVLGRSRVNEVTHLPGGMLIKPEAYDRPDGLVNALRRCSKALAAENIRMMYVQLPCKDCLSRKDVPAGAMGNCANRVRDDLLSSVKKLMPVFDVRPVVVSDWQALNENFLMTDHHWTFDGAFKGFRAIVPEIMAVLNMTLPEPLMQLDPASWSHAELPRRQSRFLGSQGRRTGPWFSGYDELEYLLPRFFVELDVDLTDRYGKRVHLQGEFRQVLINHLAIAEPRTCYEDYGYDVYLGDHARVVIRNTKAPIDRSLFVIKDSFAQPLVAWLSTVFSEVIVVDPRYDKRNVVAEILDDRPDLVLVMLSVPVVRQLDIDVNGVKR